ncbi:Pex19 protein family [Colletotrichum karsti]|uniref:Pex19 protein family n=1 Tax=Colletotrichum karsti TaxID=1095194 RepID=A0A9P6LQM5_9PEZI|nr:Pex19 protein family [Colletotrichum karsti]KAF9880892.1 Pex19 protein family [Colletotrichum karsti]
MEKDAGSAGAAKPDETKSAAPAPAPAVEEKKPDEVMEDVPDPDEDDLDDLDDMLDEFSAVKVDTKKPEQPAAPAATGPGRPATVENEADNSNLEDKNLEDMLSSDDFAKQLQAGMADLIGELEKNPEMQAQFDTMFKQINAAAQEAEPSPQPQASASASAAPPRPTSSSSKAATSDPIADGSFQETIRKTMERMQASGEQATAAAAESSTEDFLAEMMKQLGDGNMDGAGSEEEFSKMLMGMMDQLTNKEILYEPMKELNDKFPEWLEKNREKTPAEDLKRYEEQQALVKEIVAKFEDKKYADSNPADREYIVDRMQKMQAAGSPPSDLVGDMPSAQEAFNADESCNPQ